MKHQLILTVIGILLILNAARARKHHSHLRVNPNCDCGVSGGISNRIIGGFISIPHIFPWIVIIFDKGNFYCGGTLINDRFVLTAGHCVKWVNHADLTIGLGMHDLGNPHQGYIMLIDKVILHENFESNYLRDANDIALLRLRRSIQFTENITPACLPHKDSNYTGQRVQITGWGSVTTTNSASRFLRQTTLKVMPWEECRNTSFGNYLTESMMCAYNDDADACQGDSGGPLLYERSDGRYEVVGIVSWGIGCANRGIPGVYVKNTDYLNWIKYHSREGIYCRDS